MKSDPGPEIGRRPKIRGLSKKVNFSKPIEGVLRDLEDNQRWKYDELRPVELLERLKLDKCLADRDELERAEYFWNRRPRFLRAISWILWFLVALGLPCWLLVVPAIGLPLLLPSALVANTDIVRSVRWRRQYELSIDRLVRTTQRGCLAPERLARLARKNHANAEATSSLRARKALKQTLRVFLSACFRIKKSKQTVFKLSSPKA